MGQVLDGSMSSERRPVFVRRPTLSILEVVDVCPESPRHSSAESLEGPVSGVPSCVLPGPVPVDLLLPRVSSSSR